MIKPRQITADEAKRLLPKTWGKRGLYRGGAKKRKRDDGYDSQLEADYAEHLAALKLAGKIHDFVYHPFRMRIAAGAYYTPDFLVAHLYGCTIENSATRISDDCSGVADVCRGQFKWHHIFEIHEVKGFWREAAAVRVKVAADKFPWFRFRIVSRARKNDPWKFEEVGR